MILNILSRPQKWLSWLRTFMLDIKYGNRYLGWKVSNGNPSRGWHGSQNSNYEALPILFSQVLMKENDVIVDVGCGKGRVFNWLLSQGYKNKLIGIEVDSDIAIFTKTRLRKYPQVKIIQGAIEDGCLPTEGSVFYLAHPFTLESLVRKFIEQLINNIQKGYYHEGNRPVIIYYNCVWLKVFEENPIWKIRKLAPMTFTKFPAAIIEYAL